jgi:hypothetical protein
VASATQGDGRGEPTKAGAYDGDRERRGRVNSAGHC